MSIVSATKPAAYPNTAHFPGTGPAGTTCVSCQWFEKVTKTRNLLQPGTCRKWGHLMAHGGQRPTPEPIAGATPSCKYYIERKPKA